MSLSTEAADTSTGRWSWAQVRTVFIACAAVGVVVASMAALYTALPPIAVATGANQTQSAWIIDGYTLALACLVLPAGALGDRYGRRRVMIAGLVIFAAASMIPVVNSTVTALITARAIGGVGAALVMPSTLSLITAGFPEGGAGRAIGAWAGLAGSGGLFGLVGSGLLLHWWSWQSIFVALAVLAAVLAAAGFALTESRSTIPTGWDPFGALTVIATVGLLVWALIAVGDRGWSDPYILCGFTGAVLAGAAFIAIELRTSRPLLNLRLFARRGFGSGAASITVQFLVTFGMFLIVVQYLQLILGYSPLRAAVAILPMGAALIGLSAVSPHLAMRYGLRWPTAAGLLVIAAGLGMMTRLQPSSGYLAVLVPLCIVSAGLGLTAAPATTSIMTDTALDAHGVAAAVNDAAREIGAAIGIALAGTVLAAGYRTVISPVLPQLPEAARAPVSHSLAATTELAHRAGPSAQPLLELARTGFLDGFHHTTLVLAIISAAALALVFWAPGRPRGTDRQD
ncbi:MFS transporter [Nocardia miyunensis]|uniref:MFS transporter n=1 Tax=Nocardia miyunensis TaxID=282684 RepID=UPI000A05F2EA|nr:MFS transporter [Nocardia miyunensis]